MTRDQESPTPGGGNPAVDFHGQRRTSTTHVSTTDPDARLYNKARGRAARLGHLGHADGASFGLIVNARVTPVDGYVEPEGALLRIEARPGRHRLTLAPDKTYDTRDFIANTRAMLHVAQHATTPHRRSAIDGRTTRHPGYAVSQHKRTLVEQGFGWVKTIGGLRKLRHRGGPLVRGDRHTEGRHHT